MVNLILRGPKSIIRKKTKVSVALGSTWSEMLCNKFGFLANYELAFRLNLRKREHFYACSSNYNSATGAGWRSELTDTIRTSIEHFKKHQKMYNVHIRIDKTSASTGRPNLPASFVSSSNVPGGSQQLHIPSFRLQLDPFHISKHHGIFNTGHAAVNEICVNTSESVRTTDTERKYELMDEGNDIQDIKAIAVDFLIRIPENTLSLAKNELNRMREDTLIWNLYVRRAPTVCHILQEILRE